jgi:hypothetical protein
MLVQRLVAVLSFKTPSLCCQVAMLGIVYEKLYVLSMLVLGLFYLCIVVPNRHMLFSFYS